MQFARQDTLPSYKVPDWHNFSWELLEKLVAPLLAVAKKFGASIASDGWSD